MATPQVTDLFIVEDELGEQQGVMQVTMRQLNVRAEGLLETIVSYWLEDGTNIEAMPALGQFVNPDTLTRFHRVMQRQAA